MTETETDLPPAIEGRAAIRTFIEENWDAIAIPVCWNKETFDPPDQAPWIWIKPEAIPASTSSKFGSVGKRVRQDPGLIVGTLYWPAHAGDDDAYLAAQRFADMLNVVKIGPVQTDASSLSPVDDGDEAGEWTKIEVTTPYTVSYFA